MIGWTRSTAGAMPPIADQIAPIAGLVAPTAARVAAWADWAATAAAQMVGMAVRVVAARVVSIPDPAPPIGALGAASIAAQDHSHSGSPVSAGNSPRCPVEGNHRVAEVGS